MFEYVEALEALGYFFGFWLFIFSHSFRRTWIHRFRAATGLKLVLMLFEAASATLVGAVVPGGVAWYLLVPS